MSVNVFDKNDRTITPVAGSGVAYTVDHGVAVTGTDGIATITFNQVFTTPPRVIVNISMDTTHQYGGTFVSTILDKTSVGFSIKVYDLYSYGSLPNSCAIDVGTNVALDWVAVGE